MNADIMRACGFEKAVEDKDKGVCPFCRKRVDVDAFVKEVDRREFEISGLCVKCQRIMFEV